jgi:hypothetical protein
MIPLCTFLCMVSLIFHKAFSHRNYGSKFVVLGYNSTYISNKIQKGQTCYSEEQVISILEFLIDNIFVSFGGILFQQVVGIPMGRQKIFRVFQNPHVIYATTRVNSFTIFLLSLFYCRQNLCQVNRQFYRRTS